MSKLPLFVAALLVVPSPGTAQIVFQEPAPRHALPRAENARSDLDNIECRHEDVTGSRLQAHQVCMTKQQWWSYEQEDKQRLQELQIIGFTTH